MIPVTFMTPADQLSPTKKIPPLQSGDRLTRVEFERRYEAMPENVKAELIDGVVYVASPASNDHGEPNALLVTWLGIYASETPGTRVSTNGTVRLDELSEPQPDALLWLRPEVGGRVRLEDGYLRGAPELMAEVAVSSAACDLHQKKAVYLRHACLEYVVLVVHERVVHWFALENGDYVELAADANGVLRSRAFPGLWLDATALLAGDGAKLLATLREGLHSDEHAAFARTLSARRAGP
jgi:Uma2 family endonuclease